MTDYLERIFSTEPVQEEETRDGFAPAAGKPAEEEPIFRTSNALRREQEPEPEQMRLPPVEWEQPRWNRIRLPGGTADMGEGERYPLTVQRPSAPAPDEALERRLRRSSRCYDAGFVWK